MSQNRHQMWYKPTPNRQVIFFRRQKIRVIILVVRKRKASLVTTTIRLRMINLILAKTWNYLAIWQLGNELICELQARCTWWHTFWTISTKSVSIISIRTCWSQVINPYNQTSQIVKNNNNLVHRVVSRQISRTRIQGTPKLTHLKKCKKMHQTILEGRPKRKTRKNQKTKRKRIIWPH